MSWSWLVLE